MAQSPTLVRFGAEGGIYIAPAGVSPASPTDATGVGSTGPTSFTDLGLISEDGVSYSKSIETSDLKAWGAGIVRTSITDTTHEFSFSMLETNANTLGLYFGEAVDEDSPAASKFTLAVPGIHKSDEIRMSIDWIETYATVDYAFRMFIPRATVTATEEFNVQTESAVQYGVTIKALADTNGNAFYIWGAEASIGIAQA